MRPGSPWLLRALAPLAVLTPGLTCVAPRIMGTFFIAFGLIGMIADAWQNRRAPVFDCMLKTLFAAVLAWAALGIYWSIAPDDGIGKLAQLTGVFFVAAFLKARIDHFGPDDLDLLGRLMLGGLILGAGVYYFEWASGFLLYDLIRPGNADVIDNKQNKAIVMLTLWAALCFPHVYASRRRVLWALYLALSAAVVAATAWSPSNSAHKIMAVMAVLTPLIVFVPRRKLMIAGAVAGMILLSFGMLPGSRHIAIHHADVYRDASIPSSIKARLEMWDQVSRRILERPVLGWGLDTSPSMPNRGEYLISISDNPADPNHQEIAHLHPHNAPLQIWFELGLPGMLALSALLVLIGRGLGHIRGRAAYAFGLALFCQIFLYTLSIWGIWQTWFLCLICFAGLMAQAGARRLDTQRDL